MSSTSHITGFGDNAKPSSKVLRPPGGGTSDIFGSDSQSNQIPRTVRNHMQSNIFGATDQHNAVKNNGDSVRRSQKNIDSYSRLFGEPERPMTPAKNHMKSSIPIGPNAGGNAKEINGSSSASSSSSSTSSAAAAPITTNGHTARNGNKFENGGDHQNGVTKTDGTTAKFATSQANAQYKNQNTSSRIKTINQNNAAANAAIHVPMTNGTAKKIVNGVNGGGDGGGSNNGNENESSSSNTTSSLVSPASTTTTTTTTTNSFSEAIKYGNSPKYMFRNPVTGYGIEEPVQRPRRTIRRDGNPVTGEGYKPAGAEINTSVPALNGANQVIIKNRIPPGGYSSGLW